jgi:hypothetical protein
MGTDKQQNPKLDLKLNETVRVKLLRDKAFEGQSNYGPYFLYSVEDSGVEKSFFAPEEIHQQIVAHGLKAGSEFTLKKVAAQNGKKINGQLLFEPITAPAAQPAGGKLNGHTDNFKAIMQQCLEEAVELTKAVQGVPFQNEDIRAISSCLFIARTKSNGFTQ